MGDIEAGQVVADRFEVLSLLGSGGMAEVFLARDQSLPGGSDPVVLKRIFPHLAKRLDFVRMFGDEARIALTLRHPNIATVHELVLHDGIPLLVMEHVEGVSFLDWIVGTTEEPMRIGLLVEALRQACDGLEYAHGLVGEDGAPLGIVHRDISPQNLLVSTDGVVKIIDFGVANAAIKTDRTQAGVLKGKYPYMAPERVKGTAEDSRSDLFSLGVVAFEMSTAKRLFWRESDYQTLHAIVAGPVPQLNKVCPDIPPEWDVVVRRALTRQPQQRYQTAREMGRALVRAASSVGFEPDPSGLAQLAKRLAFGASDQKLEAFDGSATDPVSKAMTLPFAVSDFEDGWDPSFSLEEEPTVEDTPYARLASESSPSSVDVLDGHDTRVEETALPDHEGLAGDLSGEPSRQEELQALQQRAQQGAGRPAGVPAAASRRAAAEAGYRLPRLPAVPEVQVRSESIPDCFSYALGVVAMVRARKRTVAVLDGEVLNLERERVDLFARVGERLRGHATEIDRHLATEIARAHGDGGSRSPELGPDWERRRQELVQLDGRLPELEGAVQRAPAGEPRRAAEAMLFLARQRHAQLRTELGSTASAPAVPQEGPGADGRLRKLLSDLGRMAWKSDAGRDHAADLFRGLERCQKGIEACRDEVRDQQKAMVGFERRPVAVAVLTIAIPVTSVLALVVLLAMGGWLG